MAINIIHLSIPTEPVIFDLTTRENPLLIIQPIPEGFEGNPEKPVLLGPELDTTLISIGEKVPSKCYASRIHLKNDGEGLEIEGLDISDPFDVVSYVGGLQDFADEITAVSDSFSFSITTAYDGARKLENAFCFSLTSVTRPTLVIYRNTLAIHVAPALLGAKADPKKLDEGEELLMLHQTFQELVDKVLRDVNAGGFIYID